MLGLPHSNATMRSSSLGLFMGQMSCVHCCAQYSQQSHSVVLSSCMSIAYGHVCKESPGHVQEESVCTIGSRFVSCSISHSHSHHFALSSAQPIIREYISSPTSVPMQVKAHPTATIAWSPFITAVVRPARVVRGTPD
jgi:hypothetical protein